MTTEIEVQAMGPEYAVGHYMTATYFGSLANEQNQRYVAAFRRRFGDDAVTHVPQVGAYNAMHLVAAAAARARTSRRRPCARACWARSSRATRRAGRSPCRTNHHTDHPSYIGRGRDDGQFDIVASYGPRQPDPYPPSIVHESRRRPQPAD